MVCNTAKQFFLLRICNALGTVINIKFTKHKHAVRNQAAGRGAHTRAVQSDGRGLTGSSSSRPSLDGCRRPGLDGEQQAGADGLEEPAALGCWRTGGRGGAGAAPGCRRTGGVEEPATPGCRRTGGVDERVAWRS
jgi:hypothetical protein